jgi:hypothetical protein
MDTLQGFTAETMKLAKEAMLQKATTTGITVATGLQAYPLEAPAKSLYPVLTPLRNRIGREPGIGNAWHWKAITAINVANLGPFVAEGARNSVIQSTEVDKTASFKTLGMEGKVTQEAIWQARGYEDARARSSMSVLQALMIQEEQAIVGGLNTAGQALGTTGTVTLSAAGAGATLPTLTYDVVCVALSYQGWLNSSVAGGVVRGAIKSAIAQQAITLGQILSCSVVAITGAFAYAWYVGGAAAAKLEKITTINSATFSAALAGTGQAATTGSLSTDNSLDANGFDGLLTQAQASGSGAYLKVFATGVAGTGTPLTTDSGGGVTEIDAALQSLWDNQRIGPTAIWVNSQENRNITKKVIAAGAGSLIRATTTPDGMSNIQAGARVGSYFNKFTSQVIPVLTHPYMPPGAIFGQAEELPYPNNDVPAVLTMRVLQEYVDLDFAFVTRAYEHGVYCSEVLQNYFPSGGMLLTNVADG